MPVTKSTNPKAQAACPRISCPVEMQVMECFAHFDPFAPFIAPKHIAPAVKLSVKQVHAYCRQCKALKSWQGGTYRFMLDDPGHVDALKALLRLILWSRHDGPNSQN